METKIQNGHFYAKIPLKELAASPFSDSFYLEDNVPEVSDLWETLQKLAKDHDKKADKIIKSFAKKHAKQAKVSPKKLYTELDELAYESRYVMRSG